MMTENKLPVSEQFLSIQGEGRYAGVPSYFLRLKSCNLLCGGKGTDKDGKLHDKANWRCDTIEVWLKGVDKSFSKIVDDFGDEFFRNLRNEKYHLVITGGEPLLHQIKILEFLKWLSSINGRPIVEIETNGTIKPTQELVREVFHFTVSPKLSNSGMPFGKRIIPSTLIMFKELSNINSYFKFVIKDMNDFAEMWKLVNEIGVPVHQVSLMPAADNREDLQKVSEFVVSKCIQYGFNFSSRLHINIWDKKTGV